MRSARRVRRRRRRKRRCGASRLQAGELEGEESRARARLAELARRLAQIESDVAREGALGQDASEALTRIAGALQDLGEETAAPVEEDGAKLAEAEAAVAAAEAALTEATAVAAELAAERRDCERRRAEQADRVARLTRESEQIAGETRSLAAEAGRHGDAAALLERYEAEKARLAAAEREAEEAECKAGQCDRAGCERAVRGCAPARSPQPDRRRATPTLRAPRARLRTQSGLQVQPSTPPETLASRPARVRRTRGRAPASSCVRKNATHFSSWAACMRIANCRDCRSSPPARASASSSMLIVAPSVRSVSRPTSSLWIRCLTSAGAGSNVARNASRLRARVSPE